MSGVPLLAALPMYDFPETATANDALWAAMAASLRAAGVAAPIGLTRAGDPEPQWRDPGLIFGQTCGYPYAKGLRDDVALIATPHYAFPGCEGAAHRSFFIRRRDDARRSLADFCGARAAINGWTSNTGMNLFRAAIAPVAGGKPFFREVNVTGSHEASLVAVAEGRADIAAIDCVTVALLARSRAEIVAGVAIVAESRPSPGLPFIASARAAPATIAAVREALLMALAQPSLAKAREALGLVGASAAAPADYEAILAIEREAARAGYPRLE